MRRPLVGALAVVRLVMAAVIAAAPTPLGSLARYLYERAPVSTVYQPTPPVAPDDAYTLLHAELVRLNELDRELTLRVAGNHICTGCGFRSRVTFFSLPPEGILHAGLPPSAAITLPAGAEFVSADLRLPVAGEIFVYPFDRYVLRLGVALEHLPPPGEAGGAVTLSAAQAEDELFVSLEAQLPQLEVVTTGRAGGELGYEVLGADRPGYPEFIALDPIALERPAYVKVQVVLVVALVAAGALYTTWLDPFGSSLANASRIALGVWGVRALMLGSLPPHATAVDAVLALAILLVLGSLTVRAVQDLRTRAGLWARPAGLPAGAPAARRPGGRRGP